MKQFPFQLDTEYASVITVEALVEGHEILLALDTAASQTVLDLNVLMILGYSASNLGKPFAIETANGMMPVQMAKVKSLSSLGITRAEFDVLTYDFFEKGLVSDQDGLIGLDFFKNTILTIDFQKQFIVVKQ